MGFVMDAIIDWIGVSLLERLHKSHPVISWTVMIVGFAFILYFVLFMIAEWL